MRLSRCSAVLGAFAVVVASTPRAHAERATPHVVVSAPTAALCPTESELVGQVEARLMPTSVVDPKQRFEVAIEAVPSGVSARLVVRDAEDASAERLVEAESCEDVFDTVAFIVAMTIDPKTASSTPTSVADASAPILPEAAAPAATDPPALALEPPRPPVVRAATGAEEKPPDRGQRPPASSKRSVVLELGGGVEGTTAVAPGFTPAGRLFGALRLPSVGVVYPSFRLSAARSVERDAAVDDERGGYLRWTAGRLEACASSGFGSRLVVDLCPAADLGVSDGEGYGVVPKNTTARTWFSLDLLGRLGFLAGDWVLLQAESGLVVPVTRDTYLLQGPDAEVFETPALALTVGAGLGLRLP